MASNSILVHLCPLKRTMSSLHAKKMKKMECYTEVAVPYGVQKLSGVDLNVPKKKWFCAIGFAKGLTRTPGIEM